jgi:hypothetical protein
MSNGRESNGYIPIVGVEAASDPNAIYIIAVEPGYDPKDPLRRVTKQFHLTINSVVASKMVDDEWVDIPRGEEQPFNVPAPLPNREPVVAGRFYYFYLEPNPKYKGTERVRAVVHFLESDVDGLNAVTGTYVHEVKQPHRR